MLCNRISRRELRVKSLQQTSFRRTLSFYRYCDIADPHSFRDHLYKQMSSLDVLGRIYVAKEGINAQISVVSEKIPDFFRFIKTNPYLQKIAIKFSIEDRSNSFIKLVIKVKKTIVADGLENFVLKEVGEPICAEKLHSKISSGAIMVDVRNHYESEVGHFIGAKLSNTETFRDALRQLPQLIGSEQNQEIILYCTGGIRCEKASGYLKNLGYKNIYQLEGGIISYVHQVTKKKLSNLFIGKNFVFDDRLGERITTDAISQCHLCESANDQHTNCKNDGCHLLFIQCDSCKDLYQGCCSIICQSECRFPEQLQKIRRKGISAMGTHKGPWHHSRLKKIFH